MRHTLSFDKIPAKMVIMMVNCSVFWINSFPFSAGVGGNLIPTTIITGSTIDFVVHCKL